MARTDDSDKREVNRAAADAGMYQFSDARAQTLVSELAAKTSSMNINTDAALYQTAKEMNLGEIKTDEVRFSLGGVDYIAQGFADGILYVEDGNWSSFRKVDWPPSPSASGERTAKKEEGGLEGGTRIEP